MNQKWNVITIPKVKTEIAYLMLVSLACNALPVGERYPLGTPSKGVVGQAKAQPRHS